MHYVKICYTGRPYNGVWPKDRFVGLNGDLDYDPCPMTTVELVKALSGFVCPDNHMVKITTGGYS